MEGLYLKSIINGREVRLFLATGELWMFNIHCKKWAKKALTKTTNGYFVINISKKLYLHHRVVYKMHHTDWDIDDSSMDNLIDHIDTTRNNNCIPNLRCVTHQQNMTNPATPATGCYWDKKLQKWRAQIRANNKRIHIGLYETKLEAQQAYLDAKKFHHNIIL
jgi:hypothetical protein